MNQKRPLGLLIIVSYKVLFAGLLAIASTVLWVTYLHQPSDGFIRCGHRDRGCGTTAAKLWAQAMTMILVGLGVVPEIYELSKGFSPLKLSIFVINLAIFTYLVQFFLRQLPAHQTHRPK